MAAYRITEKQELVEVSSQITFPTKLKIHFSCGQDICDSSMSTVTGDILSRCYLTRDPLETNHYLLGTRLAEPLKENYTE